MLSGKIEGPIYLEDQVELILHAAANRRFADPETWITAYAEKRTSEALMGIW